MRYRDMTPEQKKAKKASNRRWRNEHREEYNARKGKWRDEHREEYKSYQKKYQKKYIAMDVNTEGVTKNRIRTQSARILYNTHAKISGYEIHHCFGYEDPNRFIYIPKTLHTQIHRLLREKNISAESNHWNAIRDLVNSCEEYTYVRV